MAQRVLHPLGAHHVGPSPEDWKRECERNSNRELLRGISKLVWSGGIPEGHARVGTL
jgi:hypothetical protein